MVDKIGVIILNWNNYTQTLSCLTQLKKSANNLHQLVTIVVDNGSVDESVRELRKQQNIHLIESGKNLGFAGGNNLGIKKGLEIGCDYILLVNNDTLLSPNFIEPLVDVLKKDPQAGIASPKILYEEPPNTIWYAGGKFVQPRILGTMLGMGEKDNKQFDQPKIVDFCVGCCMLIKRQVFESIGMLDEHLFFYHEDVDFSLRAKKAGFTCWYEPGSSVIHKVSYSTQENLPLRTYLYSYARVIFFFKHIRGLWIPVVFGMETIRFVRQIISIGTKFGFNQVWSYIRGVFNGIRDGVKMLTENR